MTMSRTSPYSYTVVTSFTYLGPQRYRDIILTMAPYKLKYNALRPNVTATALYALNEMSRSPINTF